MAALRGAPTDRKPVVLHPGGTHPEADALVFTPHQALRELGERPHQAVLARVLNPFARAEQADANLNLLLHDDPETGEAALADFEDACRQEMAEALDAGLDGIYYVIAGAHPRGSTPMQYGGHYLEVDRRLLAEVSDARCVIGWVDAPADPYLDFLSDLPCHALGWDVAHSEVPLDDVRAMRGAAVACAHPSADLYLVHQFEQAAGWAAKEAIR